MEKNYLRLSVNLFGVSDLNVVANSFAERLVKLVPLRD